MCKLLLDAVSESGIGAVLGFILSYVAEWVPGFDLWPARVKRIVILAACMLIGVGLWLLGYALGCEDSLTIEGAWAALAAGFAAFSASQVAHARKL
ncbi:MAG: hypothetical protein WC683_12680 [bacterium]